MSTNYPDNVSVNDPKAPWNEQDSNWEPVRCKVCGKAMALNTEDICQDCFDSLEE